MKILAICDTPTPDRNGAVTGFGVVVKNLLPHWAAAGHEVHVWAINFNGHGYGQFPQLKLIPAVDDPRVHWWKQLGGALSLLAHGDYTHVWLLNDLQPFTLTDFPKKLRHVCATKKIRSLLYFPADAALDTEWIEILRHVDEAVTYTQAAVAAVRAAGGGMPVRVLPHGVDTERFRPLPDRKQLLREIIIKPTANSERPFARDEDFLLVNVNKNEWRKDPFRSLEILAGLKRAGVPAKLIFRMAPHSGMGGVDLEAAGKALGLKLDVDWTHLGPMTEEALALLYNAADLYLTTTLGEGWGLGITEALACGCAVALPEHTACGEIRQELLTRGVGASRFISLPAGEAVFGPFDSRRRERVDLAGSVEAIATQYARHRANKTQTALAGLAEGESFIDARPALPAAAQHWLHWPRSAEEMLKLLQGRVSREGAKATKDSKI